MIAYCASAQGGGWDGLNGVVQSGVVVAGSLGLRITTGLRSFETRFQRPMKKKKLPVPLIMSPSWAIQVLITTSVVFFSHMLWLIVSYR